MKLHRNHTKQPDLTPIGYNTIEPITLAETQTMDKREQIRLTTLAACAG
ncbi:hypothetical protein [Chloroflexus sp.]|jgi:hypothetical protein|nr:hypothetical protein [Chloroflexus sp.]GIV93656.1 MAG: hypothetical protein KatS3mg056_2365 [Chloroflexus sp.]